MNAAGGGGGVGWNTPGRDENMSARLRLVGGNGCGGGCRSSRQREKQTGALGTEATVAAVTSAISETQ